MTRIRLLGILWRTQRAGTRLEARETRVAVLVIARRACMASRAAFRKIRQSSDPLAHFFLATATRQRNVYVKRAERGRHSAQRAVLPWLGLWQPDAARRHHTGEATHLADLTSDTMFGVWPRLAASGHLSEMARHGGIWSASVAWSRPTLLLIIVVHYSVCQSRISSRRSISLTRQRARCEQKEQVSRRH